MHQFISMMFSLLVMQAAGLQVSVQAGESRPVKIYSRPYKSEMFVPNGGKWGSWGEREMCPTGMYAAGFSLKVEYPLGSGDNTALNGIRLHCIKNNSEGLPHSYHDYASVRSDVGSWGEWTDIKWCSSGFLTAFKLRVQSSQGDGDDTAANNIWFKCSQGALQGDGTDWGDWGGWSQTCYGKGICGIKTRVQGPQCTGDDTALNDVRMFCCS